MRNLKVIQGISNLDTYVGNLRGLMGGDSRLEVYYLESIDDIKPLI